MAANFEQWFNDKYGKNQSYGRGVALEAWNAAIKSVVEPFTSYNKQNAKVCDWCGKSGKLLTKHYHPGCHEAILNGEGMC